MNIIPGKLFLPNENKVRWGSKTDPWLGGLQVRK